MVKIYGHYALTKTAKITYHRYLIHSYDLSAYDGKDKWTAYNFVRKVYDHFAPILLKIIRDAIPNLRKPDSESFMSIANSENESELLNSQETPSAPASQDNTVFKKPSLPPKVRLQKENDRLKEQLDQLLEQQRQESERQRQELERQRQDNAGLKGQIDLLMDLLKKSQL